MKIYVAAVEALRKKERQGETQITFNIDGYLSFTSPLNDNVFFAGIFLISPCVLTKLRVLVLSFPGFTDISIETSFCANKMMNGVFFLWENFRTAATKNKILCNSCKFFLLKNMCQSCQILRFLVKSSHI